ncbi:LysR family transcriptional regulator [Pigmentiphaga sp. YJ18]|uniref:LysR family transcriptional regulator n=1 Tax=Pigmentiphaga sp. YJ18 TaxID=3134907 RepID=UPI0031153A6D
MLMKTGQMRALVACALHRSLRAAAEHLALSHSALTKTIRELEAELGVPLLVRSSRGIELTRYGQVAAARAQTILADLRRAGDELAQLRGGRHGRITVGASASMAFFALPPAITRFREKQPGIEIEVIELSMDRTPALLESGVLDFLVVHHELPDLPAGCGHDIAGRGSLVAVARRGHPASSSTTLADLSGHAWIYPGQLVKRAEFDQVFVRTGAPPPAQVMSSQSAFLTLRLLMDAEMIALMPRPFVRHALFAGHLAELPLADPLPAIAAGTVTRTGICLPPATEQFRQAVLDAIRGLDW